MRAIHFSRIRYETFSKFSAKLNSCRTLDDVSDCLKRYLKYMFNFHFFRLNYCFREEQYIDVNCVAGDIFIGESATPSYYPFELELLENGMPLYIESADVTQLLLDVKMEVSNPVSFWGWNFTGEKRQILASLLVDESKPFGVKDVNFLKLVSENVESKLLELCLQRDLERMNEEMSVINRQQREMIKELNEAKNEVESLSRSKDVFLASVSHEIRTPMNAILGIAGLMSKTRLDDRQKHYVSTISDATNNLLVLINDLLDFSKIEAGKLALEQVGMDLKAIISNAIAVLKHKAAEKNLFLYNLNCPEMAPVHIGDPYRLNQVLMNLLSNAIKFTERGSVSVDCHVVEDTPTEQLVSITVADTGIGMDQAFVRTIFDKFTQENKSITRKYGGTGLGMSITRELVQIMGGELSVESLKGVGTSVSFTLRFQKGSTKDVPVKEHVSLSADLLKGVQILLVEDNEANRLVAGTILNYYGAVVTEAESGEVAISKITERRFDVVLMDVQMPNMDGFEATGIIRAKIDKHIPIVALTANAMMEERDRCLKSGMNDFISKPYKEQDLISVIAKMLGRETSAISDEENIQPAKPDAFSLDNLFKVGRGNVGFVLKMVSLFIENTPRQLDEIEEAHESGDFVRMRRLVHQMKPSVFNLEVEGAKEDVLFLEQEDIVDPVFTQICVRRLKSVLTAVVKQLKITALQLGDEVSAYS